MEARARLVYCSGGPSPKLKLLQWSTSKRLNRAQGHEESYKRVLSSRESKTPMVVRFSFRLAAWMPWVSFTANFRQAPKLQSGRNTLANQTTAFSQEASLSINILQNFCDSLKRGFGSRKSRSTSGKQRTNCRKLFTEKRLCHSYRKPEVHFAEPSKAIA